MSSPHLVETGAAGSVTLRPLRGSALRPLPGLESRTLPTAGAKMVLVLGTPRSGSTWVGSVLGTAPGALLVSEPDNSDGDVLAASAIGAPHAFAAIREGERAPLYEMLWRYALRGGNTALAKSAPRYLAALNARLCAARRLPAETGVAPLIWRSRLRLLRRAPSGTETVIVKSVLANLAVGWITARFAPRVVILHRHPLDVIASNRDLGFNPRPDPEDARIDELVLSDPGIPRAPQAHSVIGRIAWGIGVQLTWLGRALRRHPEWLLVSHDDLVEDPIGRFEELYAGLGLDWTPAVQSAITQSNAPGQGHDLTRVWTDVKDGWKRKLSPAEIAEAVAVLAGFPRADAGWSLDGRIQPSSTA